MLKTLNHSCLVRSSTLEDKSFIYSTFLLGLYHGNPLYRKIEKRDFFSSYQQVLDVLLARPNIAIKVACLVDEPDVVLGYAIVEGPRLHWVYVKKPWRDLGIATLMLKDCQIKEVTHLTKIGEALKPLEWKFNPFL